MAALARASVTSSGQALLEMRSDPSWELSLADDSTKGRKVKAARISDEKIDR